MDAETLLRSAGWRPARHVDIAADLAQIASLGFPVVQTAEAFLREFSGIAITWETKPAPLLIDGRRAAQDVGPEWAEAYGVALGTELTPVGQYANMTVYIDVRGDLWGGYDEAYGHRGSLRELISSIFLESPRGFDRKVEFSEG